MGRKKTPAPDAEATRIRIVETAEALFRGLGYVKTTVADIAQALGMSAANVYRYFPAKTAINEAICERLVRRVEDRCLAALASGGAVAGRLADFLLEYHRAVKDHALKDRRLHDMVAVAMERHWTVIQNHSQRMQGQLRRLLDEGIASGEFRRMDTEAMARSLHGAMAVFVYPSIVEHLVTEAAQAGHEDDIERELANLLDLIFHGLRA